jgi:valyl-tRNA synthetase
LKYAWEWKEKYGGIILEQLEKSWGRPATGTELVSPWRHDLSEAVIEVFIDLHTTKGRSISGVRMVNWDPARIRQLLSDEEVIHKEVNSTLSTTLNMQ